MHYFTLWPWPLTSWPWLLTFDLWPWTFAAYRLWRDETMYQIWTQWAIRGGVTAISVYNYVPEHCVTCCARLWFNFTKFDLRQVIRARIIAYFDANTLCHVVALTSDPLTLKVCDRLNDQTSCDQSLYEIWVKSTELLISCEFLYTLCHAVTLTFDLLTLTFYSNSGVMR